MENKLLVTIQSTARLMEAVTCKLSLVSLWENFWMITAQKFSNYFVICDFAPIRKESYGYFS